jgi:hypothetical protein
MAKVLNAQIVTAQRASPEELQEYSLIGFGSGIDSGKHYKVLLDFADRLPQVTSKEAFVFSTSAMQEKTNLLKTILHSEKNCSLEVTG